MSASGSQASDSQGAGSAGQQEYVQELRSRIKMGNLGALLRTGGIQALWIVVILAGAGVPLNEAVDGPSWVGPALGFVVVVAAGVERIFARTTPAAAAQDTLRRSLSREQRIFLARAGVYSEEDAFDRYIVRCEQLIADYDQTMVDYSGSLARQAE
ncbi:MAG: hypothetical protein WBG89_14460 [Ornithinimicrobium sp.]